MPIPKKTVLIKAADRNLRDIIAPRLRVLFCGINPGLYSAYTGHHFARPGNRFWPTLYRSGFIDRPLTPCEEQELLQYGFGLTNIVKRASVGAHELTRDEILAGAHQLVKKVSRYNPCVLAILGVSVFRIAFNQPQATIGRQPDPIGSTFVWVLPSPSGLNAHYSPASLVKAFQALRSFLDDGEPRQL